MMKITSQVFTWTSRSCTRFKVPIKLTTSLIQQQQRDYFILARHFLRNSNKNMAQKQITSFFKPKTTNPNEEETKNAKENIELEKTKTQTKNSFDAKTSPTPKKNSPASKTTSPASKKNSVDSKKNSPASKKKLSDSKTFSPSPKKTAQDAKTPSPEQKKEIKPQIESVHQTNNNVSPKKETTTPTVEKSESRKRSADEDSTALSAKERSPKTMKIQPVISNEDEANYNPAKERYHAVKDAFWKEGENTPYLALAKTFQVIEETRGRLKMIDILSNFFSSVIALNPDDLLPSVYLSINQVAPAYEGLELGVAEHTLMKVICKATGRDMTHIKAQVQKIGDLGVVAEQSRVSQRMMFRPAPITIKGLFAKLRVIAKTSGPAKLNMIQEIYTACRNCEARFFIRSLIGKLRIGVAEQSLMQALGTAIVKSGQKKSGDIKKQVDETVLLLRTAFCQCPNFDKIIPTLLQYDIDEILERCPMEPGVPLKPMLAHPTKSIGEVLQRFEDMKITCEWKYDGERAQIHRNSKGEVFIYSRNQENNTQKYPDVIGRIDKFAKAETVSFIVDSEIVAWDVERQQILPFQVLTTRKRKGVEMEDIKVQVCVYAFDLLYLNGKALVTQQFEERRRLLKENFTEFEGEFKFATALDTMDTDEIQQFLEESIKGNCEGLMVKTLDKEASYEIAKRSRNWLKLKKDYLSGCGDSLDLVVLGGYRGKGKRTGTYGGFLLACYDAENEEYQTICKIGTGFSDEDLRTHAEFFKAHVLSEAKSYYRFDSTLAPDDWFEPVQIWEVKCADLSLSPVHRAGIGIIDPERGISLRFPRFIRIRDDKNPEDATSAQQVSDMYASQDQIKNQEGNNAADDFDFY